MSEKKLSEEIRDWARLHLVGWEMCEAVSYADKVEALEIVKEKVEQLREDIYVAYTDNKWKIPEGYHHAIPWFLLDEKLRQILGVSEEEKQE